MNELQGLRGKEGDLFHRSGESAGVRSMHATPDSERAEGTAPGRDEVALRVDSAGNVRADDGRDREGAVSYTIPWPPSANRIWRSVRIGGASRVLLSKEGREYREAVKRAVGACQPIKGNVEVQIKAHKPDNRRRDIDNLLKASLDALTKAGVWEDDSQLDALAIRRMPATKSPRLEVLICRV